MAVGAGWGVGVLVSTATNTGVGVRAARVGVGVAVGGRCVAGGNVTSGAALPPQPVVNAAINAKKRSNCFIILPLHRGP